MANQKITTLPAAIALVGSELLELVQAGANNKASVDFIAKYTIVRHVTIVPPAGVTVDTVIPGDFDYILDVDTSAGNVELDGFVGQRDGQRVTLRCTGAGRLDIGGDGVGSPGNRVSANGPIAISLLQRDSATIQLCQAITAWVIV